MLSQTVTRTLEENLQRIARAGWTIQIKPIPSPFGNINGEVTFLSPEYKSRSANLIAESERMATGMLPTVPCTATISLFNPGALEKTISEFCVVWIHQTPS